MRRSSLVGLALAALVVAACSGSSSSPLPALVDDAGLALDASAAETSSGIDAGTDAAACAHPDASKLVSACVTTFGAGMSAAFGRLDGTLVAIVRPVDQQCTKPNSRHLILEVAVKGSAYRLLVNVESDRTGIDPRVQLAEKDAPLPGPAWEEGWHTTGVTLDYAQDLGVHASMFTPHLKDELVSRVVCELSQGDPVSVYTGGYGPEGGHNIHFNGLAKDGAVVLAPTSPNPHFLLFHFDGQTF